jgi:hypothetical protein
MRLLVSLLTSATLVGAAAADEPSPTNPSLPAAQSKMQAIQRRLEQGDTGSDTRRAQTQVIDVLTSLIELAEQREKASQSAAAAQGPGQNQSPNAASPSQNPGAQSGQTGGGSQGSDTVASLPQTRAGPQSPWSTLRDKQRDPVFNAIQEKFPARYQQLIEQYYKSFQDAPNR